jgi:DNA repair protein RadC
MTQWRLRWRTTTQAVRSNPSEEDMAVTRHIQRGMKEVGLRFLDHVIIAGDQWRSVTASR